MQVIFLNITLYYVRSNIYRDLRIPICRLPILLLLWALLRVDKCRIYFVKQK